MLHKVFTFTILILVVANVSIPVKAIKFGQVGNSQPLTFDDFTDSDDPADNEDTDGLVEVEIHYVLSDLGIKIKRIKQIHIGEFHTFISSYVLKLFIPPSL